MVRNMTNIAHSKSGSCPGCQKLLEKNQRLLLALISICDEQIKKAMNGIKYIDERREMTKDEQRDYHKKNDKTWKQRKQSYLTF